MKKIKIEKEVIACEICGEAIHYDIMPFELEENGEKYSLISFPTSDYNLTPHPKGK